MGNISLYFAAKLNLEYRELRSGLDSRSSGPDGLLIILFSKLVCAEVSKITGATKRVFHQTVNAQNSMLTKEIHDQGKIIMLISIYFITNLPKYTVLKHTVRSEFKNIFS